MLYNRPLDPDIRTKVIEPFAVPPWRKVPEFTIESSKERAVLDHNLLLYLPDTIPIYSHGSGFEGSIEAAAVIPPTGAQWRCNLGHEAHDTVYAGELQGIYMGLELALDRSKAYSSLKHIRIFTDNQAAI